MLMATISPENPWTIEELHRLPDDENKYELVHGELLVTPPPSVSHETILARLTRVLDPYVARHNLGLVFHPRAVFRLGNAVQVEPDLFVRAAHPEDDPRWEHAPAPILVVEVLSRSTRSRDFVKKRNVYRDEAGVPEYWIVDGEQSVIHVVRPGEPDRTESASVIWHPNGASEPLRVLLEDVFPAPDSTTVP